MKRVAAVSIFVLLSMACSNKIEPFNEISTASFETTTPIVETIAPTTETTTPVAETTTPQTLENPYQGYISDLYNDPAVWLCWPGVDDACERDQTATAIYPDGTSEIISFKIDKGYEKYLKWISNQVSD